MDFISSIIFHIGKLFSFFNYINKPLFKIRQKLYTGYKSSLFKHFGKYSNINPKMTSFTGCKYISVGDGCYFCGGVWITAIDESNGSKDEKPELSFGDGCIVGRYSHITCVHEIKIGNNLLTGPSVLITDNAHGDREEMLTNIAPINRTIKAKSVIIGNNVWIGECAAVLPGVNIGDNCIIGAHAVVTKSLPPYSIAVGNPARVVFQGQLNNELSI